MSGKFKIPNPKTGKLVALDGPAGNAALKHYSKSAAARRELRKYLSDQVSAPIYK